MPTAAIWPDCCLPEQVAGAARLQVLGRDAEPGAELGQLLDGAQPLARDVGQRLLGRRQQVRIGLLPAPAHAALDLVQVGQAEPVGAVDDDRVGAWGCRCPDSMIVVVTSTFSSPDRNLVITSSISCSFSWPWAMPTLASGTRLLNELRHALDALHAVMHEEDLAARARAPS